MDVRFHSPPEIRVDCDVQSPQSLAGLELSNALDCMLRLGLHISNCYPKAPPANTGGRLVCIQHRRRDRSLSACARRKSRSRTVYVFGTSACAHTCHTCYIVDRMHVRTNEYTNAVHTCVRTDKVTGTAHVHEPIGVRRE